MNDDIKVVKREAATPPFNQVHLQMSRERAVKLFHDLNRMMAIIDEELPELPDARDQASYDRANAFLCLLQEELAIDPEAPKPSSVLEFEITRGGKLLMRRPAVHDHTQVVAVESRDGWVLDEDFSLQVLRAARNFLEQASRKVHTR